MHAQPTPLQPVSVGAVTARRSAADRWMAGAGGLALVSLGLLGLGGLGIATEGLLLSVASLGTTAGAAVALGIGRSLHLRDADAMHRSLEQHSTVLGQLAHPVAVVVDGEVRFANPAWCRWRDERLGERMAQLLALDPGQRRIAAVGTLPPLLVQIRRVRVQWGGRRAHLLQVHDQTESQQLQAQIAGRDRLAQVGLLAAGVAHEINNPLMAVATYLDLLADEVAEDEGLLELVHELGHALGHIKEVANDLRMLGRADSGAIEAISPWEAARAAVRLTRAQRSTALAIVLDDTVLPPVRCAHGRLVQVFLNLFLNAAHSVEAARVADPHVWVDAEITPETVILRVRDNGPGVPRALREHIFEAQFTTRDAHRGTGLGLWLCRRVLEEVEATLALEPDTGDGGACFAITLQRADAAAVGDDDRALREDDGVAAR